MPNLATKTDTLHRAYSSFGSVACMAFSGGRTSGYLLRKVLDAKTNNPHRKLYVNFCNTGLEVDETYDFVDEVDKRWGAQVQWLEYVRDESKPPLVWKGKQALVGQHAFRKVDFKTASRNGEPFEMLIDSLAAYRNAKGMPAVLPNPVQRFCSAEMKRRTMERFMASVGERWFWTLIGLRADEPDRVRQLLTCGREARQICCPLSDAGVTEAMILEFWASQPFDLALKHDPCLGTYEGNCDNCFLKRQSKIKRLAKERPERLEWWARMEAKTGQNFRKDRFTYTDIIEGRVPLDTIDNDDTDQQVCNCTD